MRINKLISYISYINIYLKGTQSLFACQVYGTQIAPLLAMTECFEGGGLAVHLAMLFCPKFADSMHP